MYKKDNQKDASFYLFTNLMVFISKKMFIFLHYLIQFFREKCKFYYLCIISFSFLTIVFDLCDIMHYHIKDFVYLVKRWRY